MKTTERKIVGVACILFAGICESVFASTNEWIGLDGVWEDAASWSAGIPSESNRVLISEATVGSYLTNMAGTITLSDGASLKVQSGILSAYLANAGRTLIAGQGESSLSVQSGAELKTRGLDLLSGGSFFAEVSGFWNAFGGNPTILSGQMQMTIGSSGTFQSLNYTSGWGNSAGADGLQVDLDIYGDFICRIGGMGHYDADNQSILFRVYRGGEINTYDRGLTINEADSSRIMISLYGGLLTIGGTDGLSFYAENGNAAGGVVFHSTDSEMRISGGNFVTQANEYIQNRIIRLSGSVRDYVLSASFDGTDTIVTPVRDSDTDSDGIPDRFETGSGIFRSSSDPGTDSSLADSDADGIDDYDEIFFFRTDPNNAQSVPSDHSAVSSERVLLEIPLEQALTISLPASSSELSDSAFWPGAGTLYLREIFDYSLLGYSSFSELKADYSAYPATEADSTDPNTRARLFLKFDLSSLSTNDLSRIDSVCLRLHQKGRLHDITRFTVVDREISSAEIVAAQVTESWSDVSGDYPAYDQLHGDWFQIGGFYEFGWATNSSGFLSGDIDGNWVMDQQVDVTDWAEAWIQNPSENYGMVLALSVGDYAGVSFSEVDAPATAENESPALLVWFKTDANGNRIPDGWEVQVMDGTVPTNSSDADQDGTSDWLEYLAGTNPLTAQERIFGIQVDDRLFPSVFLQRRESLYDVEPEIFFSERLQYWIPLNYDLSSTCFKWWPTDFVPDYCSSSITAGDGIQQDSYSFEAAPQKAFFAVRAQSAFVPAGDLTDLSDAIPVGTVRNPYGSERVVDKNIYRGVAVRDLPDGIPDAGVDLPYLRRGSGSEEVLFKDHMYVVRTLGGYAGGYDSNLGDLHEDDMAYILDGEVIFDESELTRRFDLWFPIKEELGVSQENVQDHLRYTIVIDTVPWDLTSAPTPDAVFGNMGGPSDWDVWYDFIHWFCETLHSRYDADFVGQLRFRISSESRYRPSQEEIDAGIGTMESYLRFYDYTAAAVLDVIPTAQIGPFNQMAVADLYTRYPTAGEEDKIGTVWSVAAHCDGQGNFPQNYAYLAGKPGSQRSWSPYDFVGSSWYKNNSSIGELKRDFLHIRQELSTVNSERFGAVPQEMMENDFHTLYKTINSYETGAYGAAYMFQAIVGGLALGICGEWGAPEFEEIGSVNQYGDIPAVSVLTGVLTGHGFVNIVLSHMEDGLGYILPVQRTGSSGDVSALMSYFPDEKRILLGVAAMDFDNKPIPPDGDWIIPEENIPSEDLSICIPAYLIATPDFQTLKIRSTRLTSNNSVYRWLKYFLSQQGVLTAGMENIPEATGGYYEMMGGRSRALRRDDTVNAAINQAYSVFDSAAVQTAQQMCSSLLMLSSDPNAVWGAGADDYMLSLTVEFPSMNFFEISWE